MLHSPLANLSEGVSLATQLLLVYVFGARYADLFFNGIHFSAYNDVFKYFYFFGSFILYCAVAVKHTRTKCDNNVCDRRGAPRTAFRLSIPCFALAYVFNYRSEFLDFGGNIHWYTPTDWLEVAWAFSIYLAIFAAVPQLRAFRRSEKKDPLILAYLVLLFMSRALYLPHWYLRCTYLCSMSDNNTANTYVFTSAIRARACSTRLRSLPPLCKA